MNMSIYNNMCCLTVTNETLKHDEDWWRVLSSRFLGWVPQPCPLEHYHPVGRWSFGRFSLNHHGFRTGWEWYHQVISMISSGYIHDNSSGYIHCILCPWPSGVIQHDLLEDPRSLNRASWWAWWFPTSWRYHNSWTVYQGNSYWNGRFRGIPIQETPTQILGKATFWHRTDHYIQLVSYQSWCLPLYLPSGLLFQVCKILFHPYPEPPEQWNIGLIPTLDKGNSRL